MDETPPALRGLYTLVTLASTGEERAYAELVTRFEGMALAYARGLLRDRHLAEDAVQEAFVEAWRQLGQLRDPPRFPGWLRTIVFKHCDRLTRGSRSQEVAIDVASEPAAEPGQAELTALHAALESLPEGERDVARLYYLGERSLESIGAFLDLPVSTLKNRLFSARKRMKESLLAMVDHEPPPQSRATHLADKIQRIIKPEGLDRPEGRETWDMFCAAIMGDTATLARKVSEDPKRARLEYWYTPPIHFAVREGHLAATRLLYDTHPRVDVGALVQTAEDRGHTDVARFLRDQVGATVDDPDHAALMLAISRGETLEVAAILGRRPELVGRSDSGGTYPLHAAARRRDHSLTAALLDAGAPIDAVDAAGFRAIHYAYWRKPYWSIKGVDDDPVLAETLRAHGTRDSITIATARGDETAVRAFIAQDRTLVDDGDTLEKRPLSTAVERGHSALVRLLLEHGADPNLREGGTCPRGFSLWSASSRDDVALARLLIEHGADPNASVDSCGTPTVNAKGEAMRALMYEHGGRPPVFWDYVFEGDIRTVAAVLAHAENPFAVADEWCGNPFTAIVCGCFWKEHRKKEPTDAHWALLRMFLKRGFRVPPVLTSCRTYLWYVPAMTRLLLEHGMNPDLPNWQRQTPLHDVAGAVLGHLDDAKRPELAALFLEFGADLHARDEEYRSTPLAWAARAGRKDMVEFLLARGAKVELPDDEPWATPLAWARRRKHDEIAALLEARGARR